jgi:DNA repair protein SbcD/Mre11
MKFLHISDIHLGCDLYHIENEERMRDYGRAWGDCLEIAIDEKVDFVLIGGDLFDKKTPAPRAMIQAISGLTSLKNKEIPAVAIEGNHDNVSNGKEYSWLHTLAEMGLIRLLESNMLADESGKLYVKPTEWDEFAEKSFYTDIGNARIFGTSWYGASIEKLVPTIAEAIEQNQREGAFHILMLHTEIEGKEISPFPLLSMAKLKELQPVTDYVALGHIHKHFIVDDWAFNPGSLEITNISEYKNERGALLVEVDDDKKIKHKLIKDYFRRPFNRVKFDVSGKTADEVYAGIFDQISREVTITDKKPIVEITFEGYLGFKGSELEINKIREEALIVTKALHVRVQNKTVPKDLPIAVGADQTDRKVLEKRVLTDLVFSHNSYQMFAEDFADMAIEVKNKALNDEEPENIAEFIELNLEAAFSCQQSAVSQTKSV